MLEGCHLKRDLPMSNLHYPQQELLPAEQHDFSKLSSMIIACTVLSLSVLGSYPSCDAVGSRSSSSPASISSFP